MNIEVNFGNSCNMSCNYCFVKNFNTDKNVHMNYINKVADWLNENNVYIDNFRPVGGEPSLKLKYIYNFVHKLRHKPKSITFVTNGINIYDTAEVLSSILSYTNDITLVCSIDRLGYDINRGQNYDNIMINLIRSKEDFPNIKYSINRVLSDQNISEISYLDTVCQINSISIMDIPLTDEFHNIDTTKEYNNSSQIKLCGGFCYNGLYIYKDSIYLCKLCKNVHNSYLIGTLHNTLKDVIDNRNNVLRKYKIKGCIYETLNKEVKDGNRKRV